MVKSMSNATAAPFVQVKTETKVFAICPCCNSHRFCVSHLFDGIKKQHSGKDHYAVRWDCPKCVIEFDIHIYGPDRVEFSQRPPKDNPYTPALVLLKSGHDESPIYAFVETKAFLKSVVESQQPKEDEFESGKMEYYYDQHTCPTNWFHDVTKLIQDGDDDPHGCFTFVAACTEAQAMAFLEKNPNTEWSENRHDGKVTSFIELKENVRLLFPQAFGQGHTFEGDAAQVAEPLLLDSPLGQSSIKEWTPGTNLKDFYGEP